ncbi:MAG: hypothetical protein R3F49_24310 [Planctomycetota bacterium]
MTIETEAQKRGACPQCGAKLPDVPVSLCPYCASPLETKADREAKASVHSARIERIRAHKDLPEALAWTPPEGPEFHRGRRLSWWGSRLIGTGLILTGIAGVSTGAAAATAPALWLGILAAASGVWLLLKGKHAQQESLRFPLLKRPALILDRRSETEIRGWSGSTTYFFKLEFEDGAQGEFAYPGLGPQDEPYATNLPGVAYSRGQSLLHFRHVRV